ncbi:MAG: hypothetical protein ACE5I5_08715 [Candidatus Heimdallarchaeota archaeon]
MNKVKGSRIIGAQLEMLIVKNLSLTDLTHRRLISKPNSRSWSYKGFYWEFYLNLPAPLVVDFLCFPQSGIEGVYGAGSCAKPAGKKTSEPSLGRVSRRSS